MDHSQDYSTTITILDHLTDAIFILTPQGKIEYANSSALEIIAQSMLEISGKDLSEIVKLHESNHFLDDINSGLFNEYETEIKGREYAVPVFINFGVVKNNEGVVRYIIASARDVGWRKEMERIVSQRQMMALSKTRYKEMGELAINLVHNVGQPLTALQLKLELARKEMEKERTSSKKMLAHLDKMGDLLESIRGTIENARRFANQTENDTFDVINIVEIIRQAHGQLDYEFTENNVTAHINSDHDQLMIMANPITLQQVFVTLFRIHLRHIITSNPIPENRIIVLNITEMDNKWLEIHIVSGADTLPSEEDISFKLDLQVVEMIAESAGGDFKWFSSPGSGIIFQIRLPLDSDQERDQLKNLIEMFHHY